MKKFIGQNISNGYLRCDCPICFHSNTFSATQIGTEIVYYCFSASCGIKGVLHSDLSLDTIRANTAYPVFNNVSMESRNRQKFSFVGANNGCANLLALFNIDSSCLGNLKYDPKEHRLVFPIEYKGENYGYVGRALDNSISPKWRTYLRTMGCPYICNRSSYVGASGGEVLLVEDCISALRGMVIVNCIALLGTNIPDSCIPYLLDYDRLYIALDPDAVDKSLKLHKQLAFYRPTYIINLDKDLKYYSDLELENLKKEIRQNDSSRLS